MLTEQQVPTITGAVAYSRSGDKLGRIGQVFLDYDTNQPEFATISTGLFGLKESFVPLADAELEGDRVVLPYDKDKIKDAPNVDPELPDGGLSPQQEIELYNYYGLSYGGDQTSESSAGFGDTTSSRASTEKTGYDTSGPTTDNAMTRSEERLRASTRTEEVGKARLRKYVVTEQQQVSVPVTREEVRVEREPITDGNVGRALDGPDISEEEHEITLHAERPVVTTEAVPVERVRLATETVTDTESVTGSVRKERIETEGTDERPRH